MVSISVAVKKKKKKKYQQRDARTVEKKHHFFVYQLLFSLPSPFLSDTVASNQASPSELFLSTTTVSPSPPPLFFVYLYPHRQRRAAKQRRRVELTACSLEIQKGKTLYAVCGRNVFVPFANKARRVEQIILQRRPGLYSTWPACLPACARLKRFVGETWGET